MCNLKTKIVDLGNYNIKIAEDIDFISTFSEVDDADQSETNVLEFQGTRYRMEYEEGSFDPENLII